MGTQLTMEIVGTTGNTTRALHAQRIYNLGSAVRDAEEARAHQEEVADIGVRIAFDVPAPRIYPVPPWTLVTDVDVPVLTEETSGEVEIVLWVADELYVGVGSDHTDRALEAVSIPWSKQACPNVIAPQLWRWADVADHWDVCQLACDVDGQPYQRMGVNIFLHPDDILRTVRERIDVPDRDFVVYCGTYVSVEKRLQYGKVWDIRLEDPHLGRTLTHTYRVSSIRTEIHEPYRVPLLAGS